MHVATLPDLEVLHSLILELDYIRLEAGGFGMAQAVFTFTRS
jgi:hypothetical protein